MKNIQVIDGAINCTYDIYQASDEDFKAVFPKMGQDIEFVDDFVKRAGSTKAAKVLNRMWPRRVDKKSIQGIHGTLFYELEYKKGFYPTKRETDMDVRVKI